LPHYTGSRFAPMCFASHRQPKREASHSLTIRLLVCINYRDRVLFPKPWEVRAEKNLWYRCKIGGAKHSYRPVDSASVMQYLGRWLTRRQYPIAKATVSLRRLMKLRVAAAQPILDPQKAGETLLFRTGIIASLGVNPERRQPFERRQFHPYLVPLTVVDRIGWPISEYILVA